MQTALMVLGCMEFGWCLVFGGLFGLYHDIVGDPGRLLFLVGGFI